MKNNNKQYVTWAQVEDFVNVLAARFHKETFSGVYGLPRGGCVLAVMLSYRLGIPYLAAPAENCLIVDDIADYGDSLLHYANEAQKRHYTIVTMFYHPHSSVQPDFWWIEKQDKWIEYPWGRDNSDESC